MLSYLFLLAAATAPELTTIDLTPPQSEAIQHIIAVLEQEENTPTVISTESPEIIASNVAAKPITITNAIEQSMLEYKHWTGKYSPEKFVITINGTEIETGKTTEIPPNSTTVEIGYTYSFMNGMKSGGRKISYELSENITQANITFDWKNNQRVILDNGKAINDENC
jgi:hypothetical protein